MNKKYNLPLSNVTHIKQYFNNSIYEPPSYSLLRLSALPRHTKVIPSNNYSISEFAFQYNMCHHVV